MRALFGDDDLFDALTTRPLGELIESVTTDDTLRGIIATDALIGTFASLDEADLRQNVCFLYHLIGGGTGDWDVPVGGMGALTDSLAAAAVSAGATIVTGAEVHSVDPSTGEVAWSGGSAGSGSAIGRHPRRRLRARPSLNRLLAAAGADPVDTEPDVEGAQLKVNMLLTRLPRLRDASVDPAAAFAGTFHINEGYAQLEQAYAAARDGRIPDLPPCEIYCHTLSDRSILGPELAASDAQTLTLFGLHLPARLFRDDNETATKEALDATLRSLDSVLGEPIESVLARDADGNPCIEVKSPVDLEQARRPARRQHLPPLAAVALGRAGRRGGHVGRRDGIRQRAARREPGRGAAAGSARIPGHNAARAILG